MAGMSQNEYSSGVRYESSENAASGTSLSCIVRFAIMLSYMACCFFCASCSAASNFSLSIMQRFAITALEDASCA